MSGGPRAAGAGPATRVRIAVIGDCPVFRHGVSHLVATAPDLRLVVTVPSIEVANGDLRGAEVVLMDLQEPPAALTAAVADLRERGHAVIVVSSSPQIDAVRVIRAGASGYLSRQAEPDEVLRAIRTVGSGLSYVSAPASHLVRQPPNFTEREQEILRLLANGSTDHEIAVELGISKHTVHSHLDRIGEKAGSRRRPDLTRIAVEHGLTGLE